jgi:hypothetical protein
VIALKAPKKLPRAFTPDEVQANLDGCDRLRDRLVFAVLYQTGLRIGKARGLRHNDIAAAERPANAAPARPVTAIGSWSAHWVLRRWPRRAPTTPPISARYRRLARRVGKKKAIVAGEHSILITVWHMLTNDVDYADLGGDYFVRLDPERAMRRIVRQVNGLGFTVRCDPIQAA